MNHLLSKVTEVFDRKTDITTGNKMNLCRKLCINYNKNILKVKVLFDLAKKCELFQFLCK